MHAGTDDLTGVPYVTHPIWVMLNLPLACTDEDRHIALMHDMLEDCLEALKKKFDLPETESEIELLDMVLNKLRNELGYSDYVVQGVRLLTRNFWRHLTYINHIRHIVASGHLGAICVKFTDNKHNMDETRSARLPPDVHERWCEMQSRYVRSRRVLRDGLISFGVPVDE